MSPQEMPQPSLALVTGASSGIGRAIAVRLARAGYQVFVDHFRDLAGAEATLEAIRQVGGAGWVFDADVGSSEEVKSLFAAIEQVGLPLRVVVNNAAVQTFSPLIELSEANWDRTIRTNLKGTFLVTQLAGRAMQELGGSIVNIGSGANRIPFPSLGDYAASKAGIEMLTKIAATEFGSISIRVNCVAPGAIENERTRLESDDYASTWAALTPLGRVGTESDVADAVAFLASDEASFVTGQTLYVDGGLWTRNVWPYKT